jgi:hypothetical protein
MAIYSLAFDPSEGSFWLFQDGQTLPLRRHRLIVTDDLTITINSADEAMLAFSSLTLLPTNTIPSPIVSTSQTATSVTITLSEAPKPADIIGFWLNINYGTTLINVISPIFFITAETVQLPDTLKLTYDTSSGAFTLEGRPTLAKTDILYRLGLVPEGPGNPLLVTLESTPDADATFFNPAVLWSDGTTIPRDALNPKEVTLDCPFVSGRALGMQFLISYKESLIYSPDPIIMDKQIGDNGQP